MNNKGFILAEIITVIAIISALSAIAISNLYHERYIDKCVLEGNTRDYCIKNLETYKEAKKEKQIPDSVIKFKEYEPEEYLY